MPAKNLREFVDYVKARPGKINYGTLGPGSTGHLLGMMFEEIAGIKMQDVPYKGAAATLTALVAGDVSVYFDNITIIIFDAVKRAIELNIAEKMDREDYIKLIKFANKQNYRVSVEPLGARFEDGTGMGTLRN